MAGLWSEMPPEILFDIAYCLDTINDITRFRGVCTSWRRAVNLDHLTNKNFVTPLFPYTLTNTTPPLLAFKDEEPNLTPNPCKITIVACSMILIRSTINPELPPWLMTAEKVSNGTFLIRKPLSRFGVNRESIYWQHVPEIMETYRYQVVREVNRSYALRLRDVNVPLNLDNQRSFERWSSFNNKVVLLVDPNYCLSPKICNFIAVVLHGNTGNLTTIRLDDEIEREIFGPRVITKFDDIILFKGVVYLIDRKGRLYTMGYGHTGLYDVLISESVGSGVNNDRRKRLVKLGGDLFLVYRTHDPKSAVAFKLYRLNERRRRWEVVEVGIGGDQLLFITLDGYFFMPVTDLPRWRGNTLVFYRNSFPTYNDTWKNDLSIFNTPMEHQFDIAIFHFESGDCRPIIAAPGYCDVFWPTREWLMPNHNMNARDGATQHPQLIENTFNPDARGSSTDINEGIRSAADVGAQGTTAANMQNNTATAVSATESLGSGVSKTRFQGVYVSSDLIPILTKIWAKHGNILEGILFRTDDLVIWALESMAKLLFLLQRSYGRSLNELEAEYLHITLEDLQRFRLNISWLVPSVVHALEWHKGVANTERLEGILTKIEKIITQLS